MKTETVCRAFYFPWKARLRIAFNADKLSRDDVTKIARVVGAKIGLGEHTYDGHGMGRFEVVKVVVKKF